MDRCLETYHHNVGRYKIGCYIVETDLKRPYDLSFGRLEKFETIVVVLKDAILLNVGLGEVTVLPGYSDLTLEKIWSYTKSILPSLSETFISSDELLDLEDDGFKTVALNTALESLRLGLDQLPPELRADLSFTLHDSDRVDQVLALQPNVIKVKIGTDLGRDIAKIKKLQGGLRGSGIKIRVDANQGYDYEQSRTFLKNISPENIDHIEQIMGKNQLADFSKLRQEFPDFDFLLDESVFSLEDYYNVKKMAATDSVKLKLFKHGSMRYTIKLAKEISEKVIFGNGVQSYLGSLYELYCFNLLKEAMGTKLDHFAEMNALNKIQNLFSGVAINDHSIKIYPSELIAEMTEKIRAWH